MLIPNRPLWTAGGGPGGRLSPEDGPAQRHLQYFQGGGSDFPKDMLLITKIKKSEDLDRKIKNMED